MPYLEGIPSLPADGPLRILAVSGSLSIFLFAWAAVVAFRSREPRSAGWPAAIVALAVITGLVGRVSNNLHYIGVFLTVGTALTTVVRTRGATRILTGLGVVAWLIAVASARAMFQ